MILSKSGESITHLEHRKKVKTARTQVWWKWDRRQKMRKRTLVPTEGRRGWITKKLESMLTGWQRVFDVNFYIKNIASHSPLFKSPVVTKLNPITSLLSIFCFGLCHMTFPLLSSYYCPLLGFLWIVVEVKVHRIMVSHGSVNTFNLYFSSDAPNVF